MAAPIERVVSPRRERRRRNRVLLAAARFGVLGLSLFLFWWICVLALSLGPFTIRRVEVVGSRQLPREAILEMAGVPAECSIFRMPMRAIRRRLESHPAVERARLHRSLPGTLRIEITERPIAALIRQAGKPLFVDSEGRAFACEGCSTNGLAEVEGATLDARPYRSIAGPLAALKALKEAGVSCQKMRIAPSGGLEGTTAGGAVLKMGLPENLEEKATKAGLALAGLPLNKVEYLDVSCLTAIVWKPRDTRDGAGR